MSPDPLQLEETGGAAYLEATEVRPYRTAYLQSPRPARSWRRRWWSIRARLGDRIAGGTYYREGCGHE